MPRGATPQKRKRSGLDKWEVSGAADTLVRAEEIRGNRRLMGAAKRELGKRQKAMAKAVGRSKK